MAAALDRQAFFARVRLSPFPGSQAADALALMLALKRIAEGQDHIAPKEPA